MANECVIMMLELFWAARRSEGRSSCEKGKYDYTPHWKTTLISSQDLWEVPLCQDPSEVLVTVMSLRWQGNFEATVGPLTWAFSHTIRILQGVLHRRNMWWRWVSLWSRPMTFFSREHRPVSLNNGGIKQEAAASLLTASASVCWLSRLKNPHMFFLSCQLFLSLHCRQVEVWAHTHIDTQAHCFHNNNIHCLCY